ncbi:MAG: hypothetical protein M3M95_01515 [Pseudomonadota bacterium]|nr:hypothetical protein [Pseudomonadota bacterium]
MIDRIKKALIAAAAMAAAAVLVLIALAFTLFALLSETMEEHWASALTAGIFAVAAVVAALVLRGSKKDGGDPHARASSVHPALDFGGGGLSGMASQLTALTKGKPLLLYGAGALAAIVLIRKPGLVWLLASNLIGMRVQKRRDRKRGMWTRG